jgi:hypothetical protein
MSIGMKEWLTLSLNWTEQLFPLHISKHQHILYVNSTFRMIYSILLTALKEFSFQFGVWTLLFDTVNHWSPSQETTMVLLFKLIAAQSFLTPVQCTSQMALYSLYHALLLTRALWANLELRSKLVHYGGNRVPFGRQTQCDGFDSE